MSVFISEGNPSSTAQSIKGTEIPCYVFDSSEAASVHVAQQIANTIRQRNALGHYAVLGLVAESTPIGVYRELIRMHKEESLSFSRVITFNINEYYGLERDQQQCLGNWMRRNFFDHVNIPANNIYLLDTSIGPGDIEEHCQRFDNAIQSKGGLDLLILGIGGNGSIGFNEPYTSKKSKTRIATLDSITRSAASADFYNESSVPLQGLTVGMATILSARKILVMAFGDHKTQIVKRAVEEPISDAVPASWLQNHADIAFLLDVPAANGLTHIATPWVRGTFQWTEPLIKRAILWLCEQRKKALLKLDSEDFRAAGLHSLLRVHGPAQTLCHRVFKWMMDTIEYHPGGREPQPVLCFSPHPDDDVISMGGTLIRLLEDQHDLHIAYMTSGNIAVFDHDAYRFSNLLTEMNERFGIDSAKSAALETQVKASLGEKKPGQGDTSEVLLFKQLIRWSEAKAAARVIGLNEKNAHFLDLPFYRTGTIDKLPPTEDDYQVVRDLIEKIQPKQIYVAGDLTDPHGTHRVCATIIFRVLQQLKLEGRELPEVLLYRGAWQEWPMHLIEVAVPLSPRDLDVKRAAIFRHESQKDSALFPGPDDPREFWERAEDRNRATADAYNRIGLPEYYALEAFVRWNENFDF